MTITEITELARRENLSNTRVKSLIVSAGLPYQAIDQVREALGRAKGPAAPHVSQQPPAVARLEQQQAEWRETASLAGVTAEKRKTRLYLRGLREDEQRTLARAGWNSDEIGVWRGVQVVTADRALTVAGELVAGRAARDLQQASRNEQREAERERFAEVEPDWPTYRAVLALAADAREARDARQHGDAGDWLAFRGAAGEIAEIAAQCEVDPATEFGGLVQSVCRGFASESQAKAAAVGLAKRRACVADADACRHENQREQVAEIADESGVATGRREINAVRPARERARVRIGLRMIASKKAGKPYLAICGAGLAHEFVRPRKASNTSKSFSAELEPGSLIHFRGATWSRAAECYAGDEAYAVVLDDGVYEIDRQSAHGLDAQRSAGWLADRRGDAHEQGTARIIVRRGAEEADYLLSRPAVLIADAVPRDNDETDEAHSPVLACWRVKDEA